VNGNLRPVEFFSRKFLPAEINYTVFDKELLAIVESFRNWRHFLLYSAHKVQVLSDHNNLRYFRTARLYKPRHARWAEELSQFNFLIQHVPGTKNVVADALSRAPSLTPASSSNSEMVILKDDQFVGLNMVDAGGVDDHDWPEDIAIYLDQGIWECSLHSFSKFKQFITNFRIMGDKLYYVSDVGWSRLYLPKEERADTLKRFHDNLGHLAAESILDLVVRRYYWPNLAEELKSYCKSCSVCQLSRSRGGAPKPAIQPIPPVALPFERLGLDFLSNLPLSKSGNRHCLTCIDYATRWAWAVPVAHMDSKTVIYFLYHYIFMFVGAPSELITDRGANLLSKEVERFLLKNNVKHLKTTPYHPATNGLIERMHGMLNHGITALCSSRVNRWDEHIDEVLFGIRVRTHSVTRFSPFFLLFGIDPRIPGDISPPNVILKSL
jgi:hypothetical protein